MSASPLLPLWLSLFLQILKMKIILQVLNEFVPSLSLSLSVCVELSILQVARRAHVVGRLVHEKLLKEQLKAAGKQRVVLRRGKHINLLPINLGLGKMAVQPWSRDLGQGNLG